MADPDHQTDPDHDAEPERRTDPRYDEWPVEHYDEYSQWPVEREPSADHDDTQRHEAQNVELLGFGGNLLSGAYLYHSAESTIYRGEIDEENERIILSEDDRRAVESEDSIGEHLEAIGDEHGWTWLSSFAQEYLEDDQESLERPVEEREPWDTEFNQRNVTDNVSYDLSFNGRHTFDDESGQVHIIDRRFDVYLDDHEHEGEATVEVDEDYLVSEPPFEEESRGDAEIIFQRQYELGIDVDTDGLEWESEIEASLEKWHESNADWPANAP